ncbi:MAG: hypothetical protein QOJ89_3045 [bacterium]|jgi:hypothetical protein
MTTSTDRPEMMDLMFAALDHAVGSIAHAGGPMTPFVLCAAGDTTELHRFVAVTVEEGLERAREFIKHVGPEITQVALAYDGYVTVDDVRTDAVLVDVQATGTSTSDVFAQRYEIVDGMLAEIGNAKHIAIEQPSLFREPGTPPPPPTHTLAPKLVPDRRGGLAPEPGPPPAKRGVFGRLRGR